MWPSGPQYHRVTTRQMELPRHMARLTIAERGRPPPHQVHPQLPEHFETCLGRKRGAFQGMHLVGAGTLLMTSLLGWSCYVAPLDTGADR